MGEKEENSKKAELFNDYNSYHEAGHLVIYLLGCKLFYLPPLIEEIRIYQKGGASSFAPYGPTWDMANEDYNKWAKDHKEATYKIYLTEIMIKMVLAGIASEIVADEMFKKEIHDDNTFIKLLGRLYSLEGKDEKTDIFNAVAYNIAMKGQTPEEGVLPLLNILKKTIEDVRTYWNHISAVASLLRKDKVLKGKRLKEIADKIYEEI